MRVKDLGRYGAPERLVAILAATGAGELYPPQELAVAERLREALRPGGILMVGAKERLPAPALELFEPVSGKQGLLSAKGVGERRRED